MKRLSIMFGVMALLLLPFSFTVAHASPDFGPQPLDDDFVYFGDETYPKNVPQGITLEIDSTSVSFQSVIGNILFEPNLIEDRGITDIYVLANGRLVDYFTPYYDTVEGAFQRVYYSHRFAFEDWNIGSSISIQIVAVAHREPNAVQPDWNNTYVVAWSNVMGPYEFKPLPVIDRDANITLLAILAKLENLKAMTESKLSQIDASIKKIYEIQPETQASFDAALANLQAKLPTEQMKDEAQTVQNTLNESVNRINNTAQPLKFGEINWMGEFTTSALDFTEFATLIETLRNIVKITLWCEFFYFVILILRPRLTV